MRNILFFLFLCLWGCSPKNDKRLFDIAGLQEGDIFFRKGLSVKSHAVLHTDTGGMYSHVGIAVKTDSGFMVVHTAPGERAPNESEDRIKAESIDNFFARDKAEAGAIVRFVDSAMCSASAAKHALRLYEKQILFDHDYNLDDSARMYCTELVWYAYRLAGRDVTQRRRNRIVGFPGFSGTYIFPSDISKNDRLVTFFEF